MLLLQNYQTHITYISKYVCVIICLISCLLKKYDYWQMVDTIFTNRWLGGYVFICKLKYLWEILWTPKK